jgi:hypothetical protein
MTVQSARLGKKTNGQKQLLAREMVPETVQQIECQLPAESIRSEMPDRALQRSTGVAEDTNDNDDPRKHSRQCASAVPRIRSLAEEVLPNVYTIPHDLTQAAQILLTSFLNKVATCAESELLKNGTCPWGGSS